MPLNYGKSKKAFSENVAAEVHAGKPVKQAVAIAYSVKRRGKKRKKRKKRAGSMPGTARTLASHFEQYVT